MQCRRQAAEPHLGGIAKCLQDSRQNVRKAAYEALKRHIEARSQSVVAAVEAIGTNDPDGFARKLLEEIGQGSAQPAGYAPPPARHPPAPKSSACAIS
mmetsp:Transcript_37321/g.120250  ORF Transcript_37321/g.120250 Transcript_37321/m.120250 type:complete len:98 (+) Transcript_37321:998-1291(+)